MVKTPIDRYGGEIKSNMLVNVNDVKMDRFVVQSVDSGGYSIVKSVRYGCLSRWHYSQLTVA